MPALMTHFLLAKRVEAILSERGFGLEAPALYWGAQGPDFFFYHRALPNQLGKSFRRIGSEMHRMDPAVTFGRMAAFLRRCPADSRLRALSYAYGFLCHLTLDSAAHPYVYWFQERLAEKTGGRPAFMHHKIEHNLDTIMLFREESRLPSAFFVDEALPDDPPALEAAARMLRFALAELCPDKNISAGKLLEAFRDSKLSSRLLMDRKGRKRRLLLGAEKRLPGRVELSGFICPDQPDTDWDYPNLAHRPWVDQGKGGGAVRTDDFFQIFDGCAVTAADLCIQFAEAVETKLPVDFLSAYDFHNGGM